jgi:hypothetical protein
MDKEKLKFAGEDVTKETVIEDKEAGIKYVNDIDLDSVRGEKPIIKNEDVADAKEMAKSLGEKIADQQKHKVEDLIDEVKSDNHVDKEKLAELDRSMTNAQKQEIMRQFIMDAIRRKRRRSKATKKKVTPKQRKTKRSIQRASRRKNRK